MNKQAVAVELTKIAKSLVADRIGIFAIHNDTNDWAVILDNHLGLYPNHVNAMRVYDAIGGATGSDGLADTPFGSAQILPPHYECKHCRHDEHDLVSNHRADNRNLESYIKDGWKKWGVDVL